MNTTKIFLIIILIVGMIVALWWFVIPLRYRLSLNKFTYARGANAWKANQHVNLSCGVGKEICVYKATQICTIPDSNNFESSHADPMSISSKKGIGGYGDFDPTTTVDLTDSLGKQCNGKGECRYRFIPNNSLACPAENSQLISTYTCVPKNNECKRSL